MLQINLPPLIAFLPTIVMVLFLAIVLRLYVIAERKALEKRQRNKEEEDDLHRWQNDFFPPETKTRKN